MTITKTTQKFNVFLKTAESIHYNFAKCCKTCKYVDSETCKMNHIGMFRPVYGVCDNYSPLNCFIEGYYAIYNKNNDLFDKPSLKITKKYFRELNSLIKEEDNGNNNPC